MKTTLEIPDELMRRVKMRAVPTKGRAYFVLRFRAISVRVTLLQRVLARSFTLSRTRRAERQIFFRTLSRLTQPNAQRR